MHNGLGTFRELPTPFTGTDSSQPPGGAPHYEIQRRGTAQTDIEMYNHVQPETKTRWAEVWRFAKHEQCGGVGVWAEHNR